MRVKLVNLPRPFASLTFRRAGTYCPRWAKLLTKGLMSDWEALVHTPAYLNGHKCAKRRPAQRRITSKVPANSVI
jgi:hypothetical protein